jgi:hypothetical protein
MFILTLATYDSFDFTVQILVASEDLEDAVAIDEKCLS